jgi:hypothetical protein
LVGKPNKSALKLTWKLKKNPPQYHHNSTVEQMLSAHNIALLRCTSSADLQRALSQPVPAHASNPAPIALLTTLQKFAALAKKHGGAPADEGLGMAFDLNTLPTLLAGGSGGRRVAIIADEAHRHSVLLALLVQNYTH